ncbi:MAG: chorismate mutase [Anaerolineae bacterium]|nr:chorismate mutase [Anaerolineae bacterium]
MMVRGVRGAITVDENTAEAILDATDEALRMMIEANGIVEEEVASVLFTTTPDLTACFPAKAARNLGWRRAALMGFQEVDVPEGLKMCVRVLIHWNTTKNIDEIQHIFLRGAIALRPDIAKKNLIKDKEL